MRSHDIGQRVTCRPAVPPSHADRLRLRRGRVALGVLALALISGGSAQAAAQGWLKSRCNLETNYFCITVREEERDGSAVRVLVLDRLVHSYTSLTDPTHLVYGYERLYAEAAAYQAQRHAGLRALFIGGGGYTFPRYMEAVYPDSELDVIEIDPGVTAIAHSLLGLRSDTRITTRNEDARLFMAREPDKQYDLILGDAFNDFSVPYHLTTREFNERVQAWLAGDGLYVINMIDGPRRDFLRATILTLHRTFANVYVAAGPTWRESERMTFVIIAADAGLDMDALRRAGDDDGQALLADQVLSQADVDGILAEGRAVQLTDRYAPVDQMLAPVFRGQPAQAGAPTPQPVSQPAGNIQSPTAN